MVELIGIAVVLLTEKNHPLAAEVTDSLGDGVEIGGFEHKGCWRIRRHRAAAD